MFESFTYGEKKVPLFTHFRMTPVNKNAPENRLKRGHQQREANYKGFEEEKEVSRCYYRYYRCYYSVSARVMSRTPWRAASQCVTGRKKSMC